MVWRGRRDYDAVEREETEGERSEKAGFFLSEKQGGRRENNVLSEADRQHHVPPAVV